MMLSQDLMFAVQFAGLVQELGVHQRDLADLAALGIRAANAWVRENNFKPDPSLSREEVQTIRKTLNGRTEKARRNFDGKAKEMGLRAIWPTFWPAVKKGKREYQLAYPPK